MRLWEQTLIQTAYGAVGEGREGLLPEAECGRVERFAGHTDVRKATLMRQCGGVLHQCIHNAFAAEVFTAVGAAKMCDVRQLVQVGLAAVTEKSYGNGKVVCACQQDLFTELFDLLDNMLVYDHEARITPKDAMQHPYFAPVRAHLGLANE